MEKYNNYLAHAGNYRYYAKEGKGANTRYFYSKEEYDAWRNGSNMATAPTPHVPQPGDRPEPGEEPTTRGLTGRNATPNYGQSGYGNTVAPRGTYDSGYGREKVGPFAPGADTQNAAVRNSSWGDNYSGAPDKMGPSPKVVNRTPAAPSAPAPTLPTSTPGSTPRGREQERYGADSVASTNPNYGDNAQNRSRSIAPAPNLPANSIPNDAANRYNGAVPRNDSGRYNDTRAGMSASRADRYLYDATVNANRTSSGSNSKPADSGSNFVDTLGNTAKTAWDNAKSTYNAVSPVVANTAKTAWDNAKSTYNAVSPVVANAAKTAWDNAKSTYNAVSPVVASAASKAVQSAGNTLGAIKNYASQVCQSASSWIQNWLKKK